MTGAGLVTPLGLTRQATWWAVLQNRCGIGPMTAMESTLPPPAEGGQAPELPADFQPALPRPARYLRYALRQALDDAQLTSSNPYPMERCGIALGTTLHGMRCAGDFLRQGDPELLKDFLAGPVATAAAGDLGFAGCGLTTCSACSSSLGSIALGVTLLRAGQLDLVVAGGYDTISEYVYGGFNSLRLVAPGALKPFARDRQGMKLSEGYGIVVLERAGAARRRGANALASILGFGESADAHHLTQPHPQGEGAARAIQAALRDAGVGPLDIDLIAAHATGTPDNDAAEFAAFSRVFQEHLPRVPVVAFKSHLGHTLGGAGAVELILSAMALREQVVPACATVRPEDVEFDGLQLSTGAPRGASIRTTLNTSLGFGGANTCVVLGTPATTTTTGSPPVAARPRSDDEVYVSGIGVVFPAVVGNDAFVARLTDPAASPLRQDTGSVADSEISELLNARRVRRMSEYVKLSLAATMLCLRHAGIHDAASLGDSCGAILGTAHGSTNYCESYYREIVKCGVCAANPMLFAEGVPNAAAAHLSLMLSLKGPCQTIIGTRTAGLDALRLAAARIASDGWHRAIVGAAEEYSPVVNAAYRHRGLHGDGGFVAGSGAVTFLLEGRRALESRGGTPLARLDAAAGAMASPRGPARLARDVLRRLGASSLVVRSGNGTWIDRAEAAATRPSHSPTWSPYGVVAECYSALPLAGIAAVLLGSKDANPVAGHPWAASRVQRFSVIATDYTGAVAGVALHAL